MNTNVLTLHADTAPADDDLRGQLAALQARDKRYTQARIAKEAGFSATVMSQWLASNYPGDNEEVERKLRRWLDTTLAQAEQAAAMPAAPDYVATPSAEKVIAALRYAQLAGDIAVVYGGAGLGKSTGIRQHALQAPNVWHATMTPASASVVTCMEEIAEAVGAGGTVGGAAKLHRIICRRVANSGGLIVVDEESYMERAYLDELARQLKLEPGLKNELETQARTHLR